jgi:hypothetical protein
MSLRSGQHHQQTVFIIGLLFLSIADINCGMVGQMQNKNSKVVLLPFQINGVSTITAVKLIETKQRVQLLSSITKRSAADAMGYETVISSTSIAKNGQSPSRAFVLTQLLPPPPSWDIGLNSDSSYSVVYEQALGGTYALLVKRAYNAAVSVTSNYPLESFTRPRFIKRNQDDPGRLITAIAEKKGAILFLRKQDGGYVKHAKLCDCNEAMMVRYKDGFILFYKVNVPGPVRGNLISPGKLYSVMLGKDFTPMGTAFEPFSNNIVFEFDADVSEDKVVIFATSKTGNILAIASPFPGPIKTLPVDETHSGETFTQPSVVSTKSHVHLAILDNAQTDKAQLLTGSSSVDALH